ncbi:hypothetical protein Tco_1067279 [Tanacetum coccineum]|uniref:Uncharacterized protein n=1 Tax=Tanacetum coccineum TaxID=301880 RepID=A0ABQ5HCI9_9ASTR
MHNPLVWRLYDTCGVHHVSSVRGHEIFMLVGKDYPLTRGLLTLMLVTKLKVDQYYEMENELLRKIFYQANRPRQCVKSKTRLRRARIFVRPHTPPSPSAEARIAEYAAAPTPPSPPPSPLSPLLMCRCVVLNYDSSFKFIFVDLTKNNTLMGSVLGQWEFRGSEVGSIRRIQSLGYGVLGVSWSGNHAHIHCIFLDGYGVLVVRTVIFEISSFKLQNACLLVNLHQIPSPPLPLPLPSLLLPSTTRKSDVPETDMPSQKRLCLTAPAFRFEVGESSIDVVVQTGHTLAHRVDYGFIDTLDASIRASKGRVMTAIEEDAQEDRVLLRARISLLTKERRYFRSMSLSYEREAVYARQAWSCSKDRITAQEARITALEAQIRALQRDVNML